MDLYFYKSAHGNFGDDLNLWFWDTMLPGWRDVWPDLLLIGIGTLVHDRLPRGRRKLVIGSGAGYGDVPRADLLAECRFEAVRGPRSAQSLGLDPEKGIIDPAIMLSDFPEFRDLPRGGRAVFVPHEASMHRHDWATLCDRAGVEFVSPGGDARSVIHKLATAPLVIAESMHAAIIADAFGTPWHAVSISYKFNGAKWLDWADSLGLDLTIRPLYPLMDRIARTFPRAPSVETRGGAIVTEEDGAAPPPKAPVRNGPPPLRLRVRLGAERWQAPATLRALVSRPGQLSDRDVLAAGKARYLAVIERIRAEMAA